MSCVPRSVCHRCAIVIVAWALVSPAMAGDSDGEGDNAAVAPNSSATGPDDPEVTDATDASVPSAGPVSVECRVRYETTDGLFVDVGSAVGLFEGMTGLLLDNGREVGRVEVVSVAKKSAFLRLYDGGSSGLKSGAEVELVLDQALRPDADRGDSAGYGQTGGDRTHVPLLTPPVMGSVGVTDARNVFNGRFSLRQMYQSTTEDDLDYLRSHISTSGSLQRMDGTPWALEWAGEIIYRDGDGYEDVDDYRELDPELYQFSLFRRFDDKGLVRAGRFLPRELPSVGYLDGIQGETLLSQRTRGGVLFGFKPTRDDLEPTFEELALVPYITFDFGEGSAEHYSATAGLMTTLYEREFDRLALLIDQTARLGRFSLYSSSEIDFDIGGFDTREIARLTRWNLSSYLRETWFGTLRTGLDHFEIADIEAERDLVPEIVLDESEYIDNGYWRFWFGASQQLGPHWTITEEVSYTVSESRDGFRWLAGITRHGLFGSDRASVSVDVYNLLGDDVEGFGGRASAFIPIAAYELYLQPSVSVRQVEADLTSQSFDVVDIGLRGHWVLTRDWRMNAGLSYALTDDFDRFLVDVGATLTW